MFMLYVKGGGMSEFGLLLRGRQGGHSFCNIKALIEKQKLCFYRV